MFNSHINNAVEKYSKNFSAYMNSIFKKKNAESGPLYDFFNKVSKILKDVKQMFVDNVKKGGDSPAFRITRIARRIADSYLE